MKILKRLLPTVVLAILLLCGLTAQAEDITSVGGYTFDLEQVYVNVPQLDVFLYALDSSGESLTPKVVRAAAPTLTIGDTELDLGTVTNNTDAICYFVVIDNSSNIDENVFKRYKFAMARLCKNKRDSDQICVFTTAGGFSCVLDATTEKKEVTQTILDLTQAEGRIDLSDVVSGLTDYVETNYQDLAPRKEVFAFTDASDVMTTAGLVLGLNSSTSSSTYPLHVFVTASDDDMYSLLSKVSDDNISVVQPNDLILTVGARQETITKALEIRTTVDESMYGQKLEVFTLAVPKLGSAIKQSTTIYMGFRLEHPQVQDVEVVDRTTLKVTFNQKVKNAGLRSGYVIKSDDAWDWHVKVKSVEVAEDGRSALLTVEPLYNCNFTIGLHKITSQRTSANVSDEDEEFSFTVTQWPKDNIFYLKRFSIPLMLAGLLILALLAQNFLVRRRDKSFEKRSQVEHMLSSEDNDDSLPRRWVTLFIENRRSIAESRWSGVVEGSMMIGSDAAQCELCLEDKKVLPQHCLLCVENDALLVRPLNEETAVFVNGERVGGEHRLQNNDTICIGRTVLQLVL